MSNNDARWGHDKGAKTAWDDVIYSGIVSLLYKVEGE